jgi:hypothetical protein
MSTDEQIQVMAYQLIHNETKLEQLSSDELMYIYHNLNGNPRKYAAVFFPSKKTGYINDGNLLKQYAANYATYLICKDEMNMDAAGKYLEICKNIYNRMPNSVRRYVR